MTQDGIFRVLNMRLDVLDKQIADMYEGNPMSPFPGSEETINQYANGMIIAHKEERQFILSLLRQMIPINTTD